MDLKHHFLIAMPNIVGDYFHRSVIYICDHSEDGAIGLMINRASNMSLLELFARINLSAERNWVEVPVLEGGPVSTEKGFVLHGNDVLLDSSAALGDGLFLSTALEALEKLADGEGPKEFLVALGYAGWGSGQLEDEVSRNVWLTVAADPTVLFSTPLDERFDAAAHLLGIDSRFLTGEAGHA